MESNSLEYCTPVSKVVILGSRAPIMVTSPYGDAEGEIPGQNED